MSLGLGTQGAEEGKGLLEEAGDGQEWLVEEGEIMSRVLQWCPAGLDVTSCHKRLLPIWHLLFREDGEKDQRLCS